MKILYVGPLMMSDIQTHLIYWSIMTKRWMQFCFLVNRLIKFVKIK